MDGAQIRSESAAASTSDRASSSSSTSYGASADADDNGGGAKVWVLVLLFSLLLLLLLPSAVRRGGTGVLGGGYQRGGITLKSGWDVVNLCLVLFAILCGLLGRGSGGDDGDGESPVAAAAAAGKNHRQVSPAPATEQGAEAAAEPSSEDVWASFNNAPSSYSNHNAHTGIRRMKSSSSYPELRLDSDGVWGLTSPELAWRSYDDAELYRRPERSDRSWDADRSLRRTPEVKTIPVDTYEVRTKLPPQEARRRRRSIERLPKMAEVEEERAHLTEATATPARSRTWSPEELYSVLEQETVKEVASAAPLPPPPSLPRRRRHSVEKLPTMEEVKREIMVEVIQNPRSPSPARFPPGTPPPPPPPPPSATSSRSKKKRSGSVGGAKELASAIALFYQKKRKSIIMKTTRHHSHHHHHHHNYHHLSDDHYSSPSSEASASPDATVRTNAPPPPPPPPPPLPPSSIFSNLFKKGGSKSRRIYSLAPPQPPPPPPPTRRYRKPPHPPSRPAPPTPPPAPVRTRPPRAQPHPQQPPRAPGYPQQPPTYPRRAVVYYTYPLPPPSPPLPPPPPPPPMSEGEEEAPSVTASPAPAYCASPDVNAKADNFIERFRAGLKLEKINSYREKLQIEEGATVTVAEEDGEFMVIGSLFEDDDDISLPETPATATAAPAAVAVGFHF